MPRLFYGFFYYFYFLLGQSIQFVNHLVYLAVGLVYLGLVNQNSLSIMNIIGFSVLQTKRKYSVGACPQRCIIIPENIHGACPVLFYGFFYYFNLLRGQSIQFVNHLVYLAVGLVYLGLDF
jgi:hypothetical protein